MGWVYPGGYANPDMYVNQKCDNDMIYDKTYSAIQCPLS